VATWAIDRARSRLLKAGGLPVRVLVRDRGLRVALSFCLVLVSAFTLAGLAPFWALLLSPLLLGVPHLLADVRYLVVRPGLHRRGLLAVAIAVPLAGAGLGGGIQLGLLAPVAAALLSSGAWRRRAPLLLVALAAWALALSDPWRSTLVLAHAHNFVAVALWWRWAPRGRLALLPVGLFFGLSAAIALGGLDGAPVVLDAYANALAPIGAPWGARLVVLFAFAQAVHYGLWLRVIPEDDRARCTPRTFRATWRTLQRELGGPLLFGMTALFFIIVGWACLDLTEARDGYLRLATFHGYLELAVVVLVVAEGRRFFAARLDP
jgi:hypothetical protein